MRAQVQNPKGFFQAIPILFSLTSVAVPHHLDADPDPTFQFDPEPDPTTHFFSDLEPPVLQNDPLRLPPLHFDADPDLKPDYQNDADVSGSATLPLTYP